MEEDESERKRVKEQQSHSPNAKRVPIASIEKDSFEKKKRCVQGTVILVSRKEEELLVELKDIVVAQPGEIAAAGLNPNEAKSRLENQNKKRGLDVVAVHIITIKFKGQFAGIIVKKGDILTLRGHDVRVLDNDEVISKADHPLSLEVSGGDCKVKLIRIDKPTTGGKFPSQPSYVDEEEVYSIQNEELHLEVRNKLKSSSSITSTTSSSTISATEQVKTTATSPNSSPSKEHHHYTRIRDLQAGEANLYGLVVSVSFPTQTKQYPETWRMAFHIVDENTFDQPVEVCFFVKQDKIVNSFPDLSCLGTIVRLHRVQVTFYQGNVQLRIAANTTLCSTSTIENDQQEFHLQLSAHSKASLDWIRVEQLRRFAQEKVQLESTLSDRPPSWLKNKYCVPSITEMVSGSSYSSYKDVIAKVVSLPDSETNTFEVTDGVTQITVSINPQQGGKTTAPHFWHLITLAVGQEIGVWIKIRNCDFDVAKNELMAFTGMGGRVATSFFRIPSQLCQELTRDSIPNVVPSSTAASQIILSNIHENNKGIPISRLSDAIQGRSQPPYHVRVKVLNVFPQDAHQLSQKQANGLFKWQFALQVEDLSGRIDILVYGQDAEEFFEQLPAGDLTLNQEALKKVQFVLDSFKKPNAWLECLIHPLLKEKNVFSLHETTFLFPR